MLKMSPTPFMRKDYKLAANDFPFIKKVKFSKMNVFHVKVIDFYMTSALDSVLGCFQIISEVGFLYTESMHAR
jgi:hypothetical protein